MANPAHPRWRDWRKYVGENGEKYIDANIVQSFPSVGSMLRLSAASILSEEGRWATQRVFSEESAALGFRDPGPGEAPSRERREALERRAARIVAEITEAYGLRKE